MFQFRRKMKNAEGQRSLMKFFPDANGSRTVEIVAFPLSFPNFHVILPLLISLASKVSTFLSLPFPRTNGRNVRIIRGSIRSLWNPSNTTQTIIVASKEAGNIHVGNTNGPVRQACRNFSTPHVPFNNNQTTTTTWSEAYEHHGYSPPNENQGNKRANILHPLLGVH